MSGSQCSCGAPATRLIRVKGRTPEGEQLERGTFDRATRCASCEAHRHACKRMLVDLWRDESARGLVTVLLGKRRAAGL